MTSRHGLCQFSDVRDFSRDSGDGQARDCLSAIIEDDPAGRGPAGLAHGPGGDGPGRPRPAEPRLVHPTGTHGNRPTARTSARHAVNALLEADNSDAECCRVWELCRPPELEPLKRVDELWYRLGLPSAFGLGRAP
ncbi:uncharacterized protein SAZU_8049 [Streptomyces azureus]|uniref:Uncharacterized protein n=1 Tax=Streptomyces azureus TaxID=146537 RepID=A0A0K8PZM4_STRAJ|nr:uncharacterized protein SAZU_8049 [Streptomyces azureus]